MKYKLTLNIVLILSLLFSNVPVNYAAPSESKEDKSVIKSYIVKFKDVEKGKNKLKEKGKKEKKAFKHINAVTVDLDELSVNEIRMDPNVEFIEPDYEMYTSSINGVQEEIPAYHNEIGITHELNKSIGSGVKVAILDTGIKPSSELFLRGGKSFINGNNYDQDDNGHGTFVASVLAAKYNNDGIVGISPDVGLYSLKVLDGSGKGSYSSVIAAIDWAIDNNIDIVSMSFGGKEYSLALAEAMDKAAQNDILLIAAAGNDGTTSIAYPAKFNSVIAVGAVDEQNQKTSFSNTGTELDLVARGTDIPGIKLDGSIGLSNGTSFAVPQVTGIAAAYLSEFSNLSALQIIEMLQTTAESLGEKEQFGYGLSTYKVNQEEPTEQDNSEDNETTDPDEGIEPPNDNNTDESQSEDESTERLKRLREMMEFQRHIEENNKSAQSQQTLLTKDDLIEEFGVSGELVQEQLNKGVTLDKFFAELWNAKDNNPNNTIGNVSIQTVENINNSQDKKGTIESDFPDNIDLTLMNQFNILEKSADTNDSTAISAVTEIPDEKIVKPTIQKDSAPYQVALHNENVSMLSGAVSLAESDFTLPGRNGLSFTLSRTYNSDSSQLYQADVNDSASYIYYVTFNIKKWISKEYYHLTYKYAKTLVKVECINGNQTSNVKSSTVVSTITNDAGDYWSIDSLDYAIRHQPSIPNETAHKCDVYEKDRAYYYTYIPSSTWTINHSSWQVSESGSGYNGPYELYTRAQEVKNAIISGDVFKSGSGGSESEGYFDFEYRFASGGTIEPQVNSVTSSNTLKNDPMDNRFPIGKGWTWNIPYVKTEDGRKFISLEDGSSYEIKGTQLKNYPWSDLSFVEDTTAIYDGRKSVSALKSVSGLNYYFDASGNLIQIKDKYENYIGFSYSTVSQYGVVLTKITDVIGNSINIEYTTTDVILTNGVRTITYKKAKTTGDKELLMEVKDPIGRKTTYSYSIKDSKFNYLGATPITSNPYALLTHVTHPTGAETTYEYEVNPITRYASSFQVYQSYRLASRKDIVTNSDFSIDTYNNSSLVYTGDMGSSYGSDTSFSTTLFDGLLEHTTEYKKDFISDDAGTDYYEVKTTISDGVQSKVTENKYDEAKRRVTPISTKTYTNNLSTGNTSVPLTTSATYDDYQNVLTFTDPLGVMSTFTYDEIWHNLLTSNEPTSNDQSLYSSYTLNDKGEIKELIFRDSGPNGNILRQSQYEYDNYGNLVIIINKDTNRDIVTTIDYSEEYNFAFPTKLSLPYKDAEGNSHTNVIQATYNKETGAVTNYIDGNNNETKYEYDALDRTVKVTNSDGSKQQLIIDDTNNEMKFINEIGIENYVKWNALGLRFESGLIVNGEFLAKAKQGYDQFGRQIWSEDATGNRTAISYDSWNRVITTTLPNYNQSSINYDDINHVTVNTDEENNKTRQTFDKLGRMIKVEQTRNGNFYVAQTNTYDFSGNIIESQDGKNAITKYSYNPLKALLSVYQPDLSEFKYKYNKLGQITSIVNPDGTSLNREYDELGHVIRSIDSLSQATTYFYDGNGNMVKSIDNKGQIFQYKYSHLNLLVEKSGPSETNSYEYELDGSRKSMTDSTGVTSYTYDDNTGELVEIKYPDGETIQYGYDIKGNRSNLITPFGSTVDYSYSPLNKLTSVSLDGAEKVNYEYYKNGLIKDQHQANGVDSVFTYDGMSLKTLQHKKSDGSIINTYEYSYDNNSNIIASTTNGNNDTYAYDVLNRISSSSAENELYAYDNNGNRTTLNLEESNQPISLEDTSYTYDEWNQLKKVVKGSEEVNYKYNGDNLLVERTENGVSTRYYYDGSDIIAEGKVNTDGSVTLEKSYLRGNGLIMQSDHVSSNSNGYYLQNGHGDVVEILDSNGSSLNKYNYDMWGNTTQVSETVSNLFRYSGEYWDNSSELQYLRSRWYDPSIGRFINKDTYEGDIANPLSMNLYTYVHNNPLTHIDPSGHMSVENLRYISSQYNKGSMSRQGAIVRILNYNGLMQAGGIRKGNQTLFHDIAQVIAAKEIKKAYNLKSDPILEYKTGNGEADIVLKKQKLIWEVKPFGSDPYVQLDKYKTATGFDAGGGNKAIKPVTDIEIYGNLRMSVYFYSDGVVRYSLYLKQDGKTTSMSVDEARAYINEVYAANNKSGEETFIDGVITGATVIGGVVVKGVGKIGSVIAQMA